MKGILEGIRKKNSDAILGYSFPKICIIRFCHIEMRVDTKDGIVMIDPKAILIHEDDNRAYWCVRKREVSRLHNEDRIIVIERISFVDSQFHRSSSRKTIKSC